MSESDSESDQRSGSDSVSYIYEDSSSEVEEWDEEEWAVRDVDGEYHPPRGPRYLKFDWEQWRRADDTSHTWEREGNLATQDARRTIKHFDSRHAREEAANVRDPFVTPYSACQIPADDDGDDGDKSEPEHVNKNPSTAKSKKPQFVHLFTEIPQQAVELFVDAKLRQAKRRPTGFSEALPVAKDMLLELRQERQNQFDQLNIHNIHVAVHDNLWGLGRAVLPSNATRNQLKTQHDVQQRMSNLIIREISLPSQRSTTGVASPSVATPSSMASTSIKVHAPTVVTGSSVTTPPQPSTFRQALQESWSSIARKSHAARITFANEVNDDDIPPINVSTFRYLEMSYIYGDGISRPDPSFFHSCECAPGSCIPDRCACQEDSMIFDDDDNKTFMYDSKGFFMFDRNVSSYVFECNEKCSCGPSCPSRVGQKPRKIPIEIFRTVECGWGVRSPVDIAKGAVLGLYTGTLLKRSTAREIPAEDARYLCDLDFHEDVIGNETGYTVNARTSGNWTRFVNHSCDPLCMLYAVIYDSVPEVHQPKLALVAKKPILAFTEITLDYYPGFNKKGKGKQKVSADALECRCGAENCRGYVYG